jgi:hypothetical protein
MPFKLTLAKLTLATAVATIITIGGIAIAQDADTEDRARHRRPDFMVDRVAKMLELDETQQAAFGTFTDVVSAQFPKMSKLRSGENTEERKAAREAWHQERDAREARLEEILMNPEFDTEAFKALKEEAGALRKDQVAEREARMAEFKAGEAERTDAILAAYTEFHRTLTEEQRQKLVWLSEQRGGGVFAGIGIPSDGRRAKGGLWSRGGGFRAFMR